MLRLCSWMFLLVLVSGQWPGAQHRVPERIGDGVSLGWTLVEKHLPDVGTIPLNNLMALLNRILPSHNRFTVTGGAPEGWAAQTVAAAGNTAVTIMGYLPEGVTSFYVDSLEISDLAWHLFGLHNHIDTPLRGQAIPSAVRYFEQAPGAVLLAIHRWTPDGVIEWGGGWEVHLEHFAHAGAAAAANLLYPLTVVHPPGPWKRGVEKQYSDKFGSATMGFHDEPVAKLPQIPLSRAKISVEPKPGQIGRDFVSTVLKPNIEALRAEAKKPHADFGDFMPAFGEEFESVLKEGGRGPLGNCRVDGSYMQSNCMPLAFMQTNDFPTPDCWLVAVCLFDSRVYRPTIIQAWRDSKDLARGKDGKLVLVEEEPGPSPRPETGSGPEYNDCLHALLNLRNQGTDSHGVPNSGTCASNAGCTTKAKYKTCAFELCVVSAHDANIACSEIANVAGEIIATRHFSKDNKTLVKPTSRELARRKGDQANAPIILSVKVEHSQADNAGDNCGSAEGLAPGPCKGDNPIK